MGARGPDQTLQARGDFSVNVMAPTYYLVVGVELTLRLTSQHRAAPADFDATGCAKAAFLFPGMPPQRLFMF